jgi:hypothetical protein
MIRFKSPFQAIWDGLFSRVEMYLSDCALALCSQELPYTTLIFNNLLFFFLFWQKRKKQRKLPFSQRRTRSVSKAATTLNRSLQYRILSG